MSRDDVPRLHREPHREWTPDQASRHNRASNATIPMADDTDRLAIGRRNDNVTRGRWT